MAKSLPCLPLLNYIQSRLPTTGLMTFSGAMLTELLTSEPDTDHLLGKPLPVTTAAEALRLAPDADARVQWLIDTPTRLAEYLALADQTVRHLRLSLELDIGLHRGGLRADQVTAIAKEIAQHPYAQLSGVMGYEAHLAKLPKPLRHRATQAAEREYAAAVKGLKDHPGPLCLNIGGSLTFQNYNSQGPANEIAFGSVLVKPSDFDHETTGAFHPAGFIATPVLKVMPDHPLPGLPWINRFRRRTGLAIQGGYYLAQPAHPAGFGYSGVFGRSSNQEVWSGPADAQVQPDDIALLWPTQSEAALNQFGALLAVRNGQIVDRWACLSN